MGSSKCEVDNLIKLPRRSLGPIREVYLRCMKDSVDIESHLKELFIVLSRLTSTKMDPEEEKKKKRKTRITRISRRERGRSQEGAEIGLSTIQALRHFVS